MRILITVLVVSLVQLFCIAEDAPLVIEQWKLAPLDQGELVFDNALGGWYVTVPAKTLPETPQTEEEKRFVNRTIHRMPSGVCLKEVP